MTQEQLLHTCTVIVPPISGDIASLVALALGSTQGEWTALYVDAIADLAPLCANAALPAESAEPSSEAAAEGDAVASGVSDEKLVEFVQTWRER